MLIRHPAAPHAAPFVLEAEGPGSTPPAPAPAPTSVPVTHVSVAEHKALQDRLTAAEKSASDAVSAATAAGKALEARLIRAEAKAGAVAAGLAHPDYMKLVDTSGFKLSDDGDVVVPANFWADLKKASPHLFAATGADRGTTTNPASPPNPAATGTNVSGMSEKDFRAAMRAKGISI